MARQPVDWSKLQVFQVDERVAPAGDSSRNLTALHQALVVDKKLPAANLHAMPVDEADLDAAALAYLARIAQHAGEPPVLDVVHLGLGSDGHTASLFPDDPAVDVAAKTVLCTSSQAGFRRMTLSLPLISSARHVVWYVTGEGKRTVLAQLATRGWKAPAGRIARRHAVIYADKAAAGLD